MRVLAFLGVLAILVVGSILVVQYSPRPSVQVSVSPGLTLAGSGTSTPPAPPSGLTATSTAPTSADLRWMDNSTNEDGFKVYRNTTLSTQGAVLVRTLPANTTSYTDTPLTPSTTYYYAVRAFSTAGNSALSNVAQVTTLSAIPTPPSNLSAVGNPNGNAVPYVDMGWQDNSNNESGFKIYRNTSTSTLGATLATTTGPNVTFFRDPNVNFNTRYYYAVRAFNAAGNSTFSNVASATTGGGLLGSLSVGLDSASPSYVIALPGQFVELARLRYVTTGEAIDVRQVALQLSDVLHNTPLDLFSQQVYLWTDTNQYLATVFFNNNDFAVSALIPSGAFQIPRDGTRVLIVKGYMNLISPSGPLTASGDLLKVDYDGDARGLTGNYGVGVLSGATITPTSPDTASAGVRLMKNFPIVARVDLSSGENTLVSGDDRTLYKIRVTNGTTTDLAIDKFTFSVLPFTSTTSASSTVLYGTTTRFALYAFTDSTFSTPAPNFPNGLVNAGRCYNGSRINDRSPVSDSNGGSVGGSLPNTVVVEIYPDRTGCNVATTTIQIPANTTYYFRFAAAVGPLTPPGTSQFIVSRMDGDASYPYGSSIPTMFTAPVVDLDTDEDFIWSPMSLGPVTPLSVDFTNGYALPGLPAGGLPPETISK